MHVSSCEFKNRSGYIEGNRGKNNGVMVEFEADINVKGQGINSVSVGNDSFCTFI